jgi:hypothetical protein
MPESHLELDLWIADKTLRVGKKAAQPAGKSVPFPPVALEMATGQWSFVMWGRGSAFASNGKPPSPPPTSIPPMMLTPMRLTSTLNEVGFAMRKETTKDGDQVRFLMTVRTVFANPPAIVDKTASITALDTLGNNAWPKAKPIAEAHSGSLFAHDYAAGQAGLTLAQYLIAGGSNVIAPLVFGSTEQAQQAERPEPGMATQGAIRQYVEAVYPEYVKANPTKPCPTMAELAAFVHAEATTTDEWNQPLLLLCGKDLPPGATGIAILSVGADGQPNTADDIKSY